jgi:hypothetical protein
MGNRSSEPITGAKAFNINYSDDYLLGAGGFAKVYRITKKSDKQAFAMKVSQR